MTAVEKKFIDIDGVFKSKNPGLYKYMPAFVLNYLKRIVHQEQINDFISKQGHRHDFDFAAAILDEFRVKVDIKGIERLEKTGGIIYASNHPLGGLSNKDLNSLL